MAIEEKPRPVSLAAPRPIAEFPSDPLLRSNSFFDWRAVFAGTTIAFLVYGILMALGLAIGGANLQGAIQGSSTARGFGLGVGIWTTLSMIASVFIGAYVSGRLGTYGFVERRLGWIHGAVVASVFFIALFFQLAVLTGTIARGRATTMAAVGSAASDLLQSGEIQDVVETTLADLDLRSTPEVVANGVAARLVRGDGSAARSYLSYQAGITPTEAEARISSLREYVQDILNEAGIQASRGLRVLGWTIFVATLFGAIFAMWGGLIGARTRFGSSEKIYPNPPTTFAGQA